MHSSNILGIELTEKLGFSSHIKHLTIKARQSLYALRNLRSPGLEVNRDYFFDVICTTTVGQCFIIWRLAWLGYLLSSTLSVEVLCNTADASLSAFCKILFCIS